MSKAELCKTCVKTDVCMLDKNVCGDVYVAPNPWFFDEEYRKKAWENYKKREAEGFPCKHYVPNGAKMGEPGDTYCTDENCEIFNLDLSCDNCNR